MIDVNTEAEKSLKKTGYNVVFQYPKSFTNLPVISFYTISESGSFSCDNDEAIQDGTIVADIWTKSPKEGGAISVTVNSVLSQDGWTRDFSRDVPGEEKNIYHKTMRFTKSIIND